VIGFDPAFDPDVLDLVTGEFDEGPDYLTRRPRGCRSWLVILTVGGSGRFEHLRGEAVSGPGDIYLLAPNRPHGYGTQTGRWQLKWAHFHPQPEWSRCLQWRELGPGTAAATLDADAFIRTSAAMSACHRLAASDASVDRALAIAHLGVAIMEGRRAAGAAERRSDPRVLAAMELIRTEFATLESLGQIGAHVGLSESRLSHLFRSETGESPWAYLERARLDEARRLLAATDLPIARIAERVGFSSEFYFSRRFRERFGAAPRQYRKTAASMV